MVAVPVIIATVATIARNQLGGAASQAGNNGLFSEMFATAQQSLMQSDVVSRFNFNLANKGVSAWQMAKNNDSEPSSMVSPFLQFFQQMQAESKNMGAVKLGPESQSKLEELMLDSGYTRGEVEKLFELSSKEGGSVDMNKLSQLVVVNPPLGGTAFKMSVTDKPLFAQIMHDLGISSSAIDNYLCSSSVTGGDTLILRDIASLLGQAGNDPVSGEGLVDTARVQTLLHNLGLSKQEADGLINRCQTQGPGVNARALFVMLESAAQKHNQGMEHALKEVVMRGESAEPEKATALDAERMRANMIKVQQRIEAQVSKQAEPESQMVKNQQEQTVNPEKVAAPHNGRNQAAGDTTARIAQATHAAMREQMQKLANNDKPADKPVEAKAADSVADSKIADDADKPLNAQSSRPEVRINPGANNMANNVNNNDKPLSADAEVIKAQVLRAQQGMASAANSNTGDSKEEAAVAGSQQESPKTQVAQAGGWDDKAGQQGVGRGNSVDNQGGQGQSGNNFSNNNSNSGNNSAGDNYARQNNNQQSSYANIEQQANGQAVNQPGSSAEQLQNSAQAGGRSLSQPMPQNIAATHQTANDGKVADKEAAAKGEAAKAKVAGAATVRGDSPDSGPAALNAARSGLGSAAGTLPAYVVRQVAFNMAQMVAKQQDTLRMQLKPPTLGEITMELAVKDGGIKASLVAESVAAKQALEAGMEQLKQQLAMQGLKVQEINISVQPDAQRRQEQAFESRNNQQRGQRQHGDNNSATPDEDEGISTVASAGGGRFSVRA